MKTTQHWGRWAVAGLVAALPSCGGAPSSTEQTTAIDSASLVSVPPVAPLANTLTAEETAAGYRLLFDGQSLAGWHTYKKDSATGWKIEGETLTTPGNTGDLVSNEEFENFELVFDWKITAGGNSGVFYFVDENPKYNNTFDSGPEYQLIDDNGYPDSLTNMQKSGANYDVHPPSSFKANPPGEWNTGKIVVNRGKIEHWLNGEKVVDYEYGSDDWKKRVAASKFAKWPYATPHTKGKLALQDHGHPVYFRNVKVKTL
ncbi:MAG: DUF1080 domain-containing protein [Bernardetiaceae bacterium]|jgi:hypothetical protein|nr:DUF1080 domain-containing protein [Bernardetiaceae bacterium]